MEKILVVDDDEPNRDLLKSLLASEYEVMVAENGEMAIEIASQQMPDLILLDIQMPGIDGYQTCQRLKDNQENENCPVIFVSAKNNEDEILKGYEVGAVDYLVKPFKPKELRQKIANNLGLVKEKQVWEERLKKTNKVAFQAMTDASVYGDISQFYVDTLKCETYSALAERSLSLMKGWDINSTMQIRDGEQSLMFSISPCQNPLEEKVMSASTSKGRIIDFGQRTIVNGVHVSILVKNMPQDNQAKYGALKDYLAFIIDGMEGRIIALKAENIVKKRTEQLQRVFLFILEYFRAIQDGNYNLRTSSAGIVEKMFEDLNAAICEIGRSNDLSGESEKKVMDVGERCLKETLALFSSGLEFNEQVIKIIESFEKTLANDQLTDSDLEGLIEVLDKAKQ